MVVKYNYFIMAIKRYRSVKINPQLRAKLQARLYHRLHKEAFDNYFHCVQCGGHKDLQIHHLYYDPRNFDVHGAYEILCKECHGKKKKGV